MMDGKLIFRDRGKARDASTSRRQDRRNPLVEAFRRRL